MTDVDVLEMVRAMSGETDTDVLSAYISLAGQKICRLAYPFDETVTVVPEKYQHVQVEAAAYMLNKRGGEGETSHGENGISRSYENADLPASMLRGIVPLIGVV